ncbi:hypothetical protein BU24DRAFT_463331 [Aaosphaeria arxii CBS 175.79]|uniref:CFEM domain-containing protein n=1 Tax=Aaosphaeria arxii CBS 175.79 TaxID=1450172 RepID=A0A6A5XP95_9PLEO|nr:uncharacterized protein BU24DRAFT_463331 [Aaosphaeria arxii CBS 175.79]KAF2014550.1 hypothetical protein BU24DRAFT_463331 [Aaosphaeria arxii CBS 175.79]
MRYILAVLILVATASCREVFDLPSCAFQCFAKGVAQLKCSVDDFQGCCKQMDQLASTLIPCIQLNCNDPAKEKQVIDTIEQTCAAEGVPVTIITSKLPQRSTVQPASSTTASGRSSIAADPITSVVPPKPVSQTGLPHQSGRTDVCNLVTITNTVYTVCRPPSTPQPPKPIGPTSSATHHIQPTGTGNFTVSPSSFLGAAVDLNIPMGIVVVLGVAVLVM